MSDTNLIVGLPAGSLADPKRGGNIVDLLKHAGFPTKGYEDGGPSSFPLTPFLVGWDGRPQEFGSQLLLGEIDVAIGGDDWIRERQLEYQYVHGQDIQLKRVLELNRGKVRIVVIATKELISRGDDWLTQLLKEKPLITMVAEMPYLAVDWFQTKIKELGFADSHGDFRVQKYRTPPTIDKGLVVYEPWGKTEAKVVNGAVDFALEITQTGSAIRNYGLQIVEEVLNSQAGIWVNLDIKKDPEKYEIAKLFLINLYGSIHAEDKVLLSFNVHNDKRAAIEKFLTENRLFGDEPTVNEGETYSEFAIELDTVNKDLPLARVRYELAKFGATNIETIPLDSSIPGLDCIDF